MKTRWLDGLALRSLFDPELRMPKHVVNRVIRVFEDELSRVRREYEQKLRRRHWIIALLGVLLLVAIVIIIATGGKTP